MILNSPPQPDRPRQARTPSASRLDAVARGFTLMELLVSISITTILLLLVGRVFNDTTRTIADSMDVSGVLATTRVMSDQMFDDGSRIITAKANEVTQVEQLEQPAGFLVIVQQRNAGVRFPEIRNGDRPGDPSTWVLDADGDGIFGEDGGPGETLDDLIRSDQFFFFREGTRVESLTPANSTRYDSDARGSFVRVWYGHIAPPVFDGSGDLIAGREPGVAPNDTINALTLGRQGLIIVDNAGKDPVNGQNITIGNVSGSAVVLNARSAAYDLGWNVDIDNAVDNGPTGDPPDLWTGVTDVMTFAHEGYNQTNAGGSGWFFQDLFEKNSGAAPENTDGQFQLSPYTANNPSGTRALDGNLLPNANYARAALTWGFLRENSRLVSTSDIDYPYANADIARTHAFLAPYVSDFAVEFTADITDDLGDDPNTPEFDPREPSLTGSPAGSTPVALDQKPDGTPDTVSSAEASSVASDAAANGYVVGPIEEAALRDRLEGSIKWYTSDHLVNNPQFSGVQAAEYESGNYPAYDETKPITWPIPVDTLSTPLHSGASSYPPYIGWYKNYGADTGNGGNSFGIVTPNGALPNVSGIAPNINSRAVFLFGHTADVDINGAGAFTGYPAGDGTDNNGFEAGSNKWWPYMIRVRYRLHDGDGSFGSVDSVSGERIAGKWFEQIIAVPLK